MWSVVEKYAAAGAPEAEIVAGLGISEEQLRDPATAQRLREIVTKANARKRLELRTAIDRRGKKTGKGAGSVNALALEARNLLEWDQQQELQTNPPDLTSAHARLRLTLERVAAVQTEAQGRLVTPAEVLLLDVLPDERVKH